MQCPPRKETRSPSGSCVHRAASSRTYCRPDKREGLKKTRATTSPAFWAAGNRRAGACADSRVHCLPEPHSCQMKLQTQSTKMTPEDSFSKRLRISVRSLWSFGQLEHSIGGVCGRAISFWRAHTLNLDARDALTIHFNDGEAKIAKVKTLSALGNETELIEDKTADGGISGILRQGDVGLCIQ